MAGVPNAFSGPRGLDVFRTDFGRDERESIPVRLPSGNRAPHAGALVPVVAGRGIEPPISWL